MFNDPQFLNNPSFRTFVDFFTIQVSTLKESLAVKTATLANAEQILQETKANLEASSSSGDELALQNDKVFIHYTLYIIHYTLYIIHYTLYIIHYTLYIIHYTQGIYTFSNSLIKCFDDSSIFISNTSGTRAYGRDRTSLSQLKC